MKGISKMPRQTLKTLQRQVSPYEKLETWSRTWQIVNTIIPFFLLWYMAYWSLTISYFVTLAIPVLTARFLIRTFIIYHDCYHHSFFKNRLANKIIGTFTGIITLIPYSQWGRDHSVHHATSSNLDRRGTGDIWLLTVSEYEMAS